MFRTIISKIARDSDYPPRQFTIDVNERILEGALYDHLQYGFHQEYTDANEYIKLIDRRPSARYNICKLVVDDSVSLLFSDGHFPTPQHPDATVRDALKALIKDSKLNLLMLEAATMGAVGSVAIQMRVLKQEDGTWRAFFSSNSTKFLTPIWDPQNPERLLALREQYKVKGKDLLPLGYSIAKDDLNKKFWFLRVWDRTAERWFAPIPVDDDEPVEREDADKTVTHNLGFVPWVWVKNLPGKLRLHDFPEPQYSDVDGACTYQAAIETMIEIEYQLSQGGRGLRYSMDPQLVLMEPDGDGDDGKMVKGPTNAIRMDPTGDAKLLEMSGQAFQVVMDWVRALRDLALECAHGNRTESSKLAQAVSGRAMEIMNQSLIWLSDRLRVTYGEGALLSLLAMAMMAHEKFPLTVAGEEWPKMPKGAHTGLKWPQWHPPTYSDLFTQAQGIETLTSGGNMSRETAVTHVAENYDVEDVPGELARIASDIKAAAELAKAEGAQVQARANAAI